MNRVVKVAGLTAGVAAGVAGAAYGAQRALGRSLRHRADPDAGRLGPLVFDEARRLPSHDGGSIYTVVRGDGPPIVLAHGVTISSRVWVKQFESLPRAGVQVVAFDHRGHGESTVGESGHSIANLGLDLASVLEGLDLTDAVLVGHSMGGMAVQELAIRDPDLMRRRVRGIVLLSTAARTRLTASRRVRTIAEQLSGHFTLGSLMSHPDLGVAFARIGFGREPLASHVELAREMLASCDADTSREAVNAIFNLDLVAELDQIAVPTLVVGGTHDVITPAVESRLLAEKVPGARLVMYERAGHMLMLERAEELDALILDFAREVGTLGTDHAATA
jgi:pimeloyl-ACP methyl ester carboxylesterase